jgi:NitT/TauT family transport system ATP-binding protein
MTNQERPIVLHMEDVYKQYGDTVVLDNIDLTVRKGELCSLVGPSGCGKSTIMNIMLGAIKPTSGIITVNDQPVDHPDSSKGIVYQKYGLYPHLSVIENVMLMHRFSGNGKNAACHEEAMEYLKKVRLLEHSAKLPHELSGGQQQRAAIAQALIAKPALLMMDEPFGALDPATREDLQLFLLELWEELQMTIFFVTHDLEEAAFVGSRLLCLSQFYSSDMGDDHGARIVYDQKIEKVGAGTAFKSTAEIGRLIQDVRQKGFNPEYLQHVTEFNLSHPDSWQTLTEEEHKD